ncbi:MAG: Bax inhibitor-1/YccA family protein [Bacteroidaceae bacterium]|nr:Bax inhibitor-1/YccA family protein [Bacteroidaceae bacterium]
MDNYVKEISTKSEKSIVNSVMKNVFALMTLALAATGAISYIVSNNIQILKAILENQPLFWGLIIGELVLVIVLSAMINRISFTTALILFAIYSVMNGVTLAPLFIVFTAESIASAFFVTAGTFGAMAIFGYITKFDLSGIGKILIMALFGLIIASIVNIFLASSQMEMIINYAGVLIFTGLTAYDTQKIKNLVQENINNDNIIPKLSVIGSLTLYLDFINLFLKLLKLMGKRK